MSAFTSPIAPIGLVAPADMPVITPSPVRLSQPVSSFADVITSGIGNVESKLTKAEALANAFALDDSIPVHQVTFALEDARLSLELLMQVRSKLVESYQQLMGMQL
jgi:flagellar hook-basal body complex protein FliE